MLNNAELSGVNQELILTLDTYARLSGVPTGSSSQQYSEQLSNVRQTSRSVVQIYPDRAQFSNFIKKKFYSNITFCRMKANNCLGSWFSGWLIHVLATVVCIC